MEPVHIIGAGIAGLGTAHYLARNGIPSVIHEASDEIGGRAGCYRRNGHVFEVGGKNYSTGWKRFTSLLSEFGLEDSEPQHPGFHIVLRDRLVALEKSKTLSGDLRLAASLGLKSAVQLRNFLARARANADRLNYTSGLIEDIERQWDHATIDHHFTRTLSDGPLRLFSIIMGAAEPDELYPSLLMLFASGFGKGEHRAIRGGVGRLHCALAEGKSIRFGERVESIAVENGRVVGLDLRSRSGGCSRVATTRVVSCVPLHVLKRILRLPAYARVAADAVRYHPLVMINAVYDRDVFRDNIHSIMFEPGSPLGHCSANRLHQPYHVRFTLSGRAAREVLDADDETLLDIAEREFSRRLPIQANRIFSRVTRHDGGICGYAPHFTRVKRDLLRGVETISGLEIAGDYLEGHTMEGCLASADLAVQRLLAKVETVREAA